MLTILLQYGGGFLLSFGALLIIAYGIFCVPNEVDEEEGERNND